MSSIAGRTGYTGLATYSGTRFYVHGFGEAFRGELAGTGVHVTAVMPGFVSTELTAGISEARVLKSIGPDDVADRVVRTLESPRFDVFAPVVLGPMGITVSMLPRRARDAALRLARADRLVLEADVDQRAAYEARVGTQRQRV
jgi:short-subunit dehydrogenase